MKLIDRRDIERAARVAFHRSARPAYIAVRGALNRQLERRAGIETEGRISTAELGYANEEYTRYAPAGWFQLRRVVKPSDVGPDDVFIDYGSGMGRVVYQAAAWYPFKRVIGIELTAALTEVARRNIDRNRDRLRCRDVELVTADALEYPVPDDVTVVYFNNPFVGDAFRTVMERIVASQAHRPRRLLVVYANPREEALLYELGFRKVRALRGWRPSKDWSRSNAVRLYAKDAPAPA